MSYTCSLGGIGAGGPETLAFQLSLPLKDTALH